MQKKTIDRVDVAARRVLMRVDFNVPFGADGQITDDRRIRRALDSVRSVVDRGGRLVLMSHCGRPAGDGYEPALSLAPAAARLAELLGDREVGFPSHDCVDEDAVHAVDAMRDGEVILLENLRFHKAEKKGEADFAARLAAYADIYCNDAFGTAHRSDASMLAVPEALSGKPRVAGLLLARELEYLGGVLENPSRPVAAVLGGAKVSDKLGCIGNLLGRMDVVLIGGAMAYTFLKARGTDVGSSLVEPEAETAAREILERAEGTSTEILLPTDHVGAQAIEAGTPTRIFEGAIDEGWMGLDIGPVTADSYAARLGDLRTVIWNGPMGVFETPPFDAGTRAVAEAMVRATDRGAISVVGGGDSAAAVDAFGLADRFSHVSTGGGASVQMLEGGRFASVDILDDA